MASKLLNAKTEEFRSNQILNYIYVIAIDFKCIRAYACGYILVYVIDKYLDIINSQQP